MSDQPPPPDADAPDPATPFRFSRSDFNLLRRAARKNWGVPDPLKTEALFQAARVITSADEDTKLKLAAIRLLIAADRSDLAADAAADRRRAEETTAEADRPRLMIPETDDRLEQPDPEPEPDRPA